MLEEIEIKEKTEKDYKVVYFRVNEAIHTLFKTHASASGITLKKWILRACADRVKKENILNNEDKES